MFKQFVKPGFETTALFANDCFDKQFADHFSFCNFKTEIRYTPLLSHFRSGNDKPFELYWTNEYIVCCGTADLKELLQHWIDIDDDDSINSAWLLNQLKSHQTDFMFFDYSCKRKLNTRELGEKIAIALLMQGKVGVYEFGCGYLKQLRYYAHGQTSKDYTCCTVHFETEQNRKIASGPLWEIYL